MVASMLSTLTLFLALCITFNLAHSTYEIPTGTKLELTHRVPASQLGRVDRVKQLLHRDTARHRAIAHRVKPNNNGISYEKCVNGTKGKGKGAHQVFGGMPLSSAADYGSGQYLVHFNVGSKEKRVQLVADTGSDLTWTKCQYRCRGKCRARLVDRRIFRADESASFRPVPCGSDFCKVGLSELFSLKRCPSPADPCLYNFTYGDGSSAQGLFANETVTLRLNGRKKTLHNVLIGCSESSSGQSFQSADGVIGLGHSNHSFAVRASKHFGGKFSYCLVDHFSPKNVSSFLIFGSHNATRIAHRRRMRYTKLVLGIVDPFYAVSIKGISVGGAMMNIPPEVFTVNSTAETGTIIDSGSTLTSLTLPAYNPVMDALKLSLVSYRSIESDIPGLEYCFDSTGFNESLVPRLVFHFTDGARFEPPVKSYVIDVAPGLKCIGLIRAIRNASVIGNILQQNHFWQFDLVNGRLGFASSSCV